VPELQDSESSPSAAREVRAAVAAASMAWYRAVTATLLPVLGGHLADRAARLAGAGCWRWRMGLPWRLFAPKGLNKRAAPGARPGWSSATCTVAGGNLANGGALHVCRGWSKTPSSARCLGTRGNGARRLLPRALARRFPFLW